MTYKNAQLHAERTWTSPDDVLTNEKIKQALELFTAPEHAEATAWISNAGMSLSPDGYRTIHTIPVYFDRPTRLLNVPFTFYLDVNGSP